MVPPWVHIPIKSSWPFSAILRSSKPLQDLEPKCLRVNRGHTLHERLNGSSSLRSALSPPARKEGRASTSTPSCKKLKSGFHVITCCNLVCNHLQSSGHQINQVRECDCSQKLPHIERTHPAQLNTCVSNYIIFVSFICIYRISYI